MSVLGRSMHSFAGCGVPHVTAVLLQIAPSGVENPHRVITVALQCTSALPALHTGACGDIL
jgi:hypothetical protein